MRRFVFLAMAFAVIAGLSATPILAQATTGQINGVVVDDEGNPIGGATVVATSPALIGERAVTTDAEGQFVMAVLPPGVYSLKFTMAGHQGFILSDVLVLLGSTSPVQATLKRGELMETVTVTSTFPLIETKTADGALNMGVKTLDTIPTAARSFRDLTKYVPSVTSVEINTSTGTGAGWPSIRGEGQYGDNYLIDGLTVRDPAVKTTATPMPYDSIEEVQIVTDGFSPEFGQALGGSVNVITKSGSNQLGGEVAWLFRDDGTAAAFEPVFLNQPTSWEDSNPYVNVGGPILKDKLWYFASYNRNDNTDTYQPTEIEDFGTLPAGVDDTTQDTYFGKLTWGINSRHNVSANYTFRDQSRTGIGASNSTPIARSGLDVEDSRIRFNYQAVFTANSVLEFKYGYMDRKINGTPESGTLGPAQYRLESLEVNINNAWRLSQDERNRDDYAAIFTQFWNPGGAWGSHEFKAGFEVHNPEQLNGDFFTGLDEDVFLDDNFDSGALFQFVTDAGTHIPDGLNEYAEAGLLGNRSEETGFFLQDRWEIGRWNLMAGFRVDEQTGFNNAEEEFFSYDYDKAFSPRLSITWDATGDGKNVVKTGWGRFYDVATTRFGEFANTRSGFSFRTYQWIGDGEFDGVDFYDEIDSGNEYDIHNPDNWEFVHEQSNESNPLDYTATTRPAHSDRFLVEYNRQVMNDYAFKVRYVNAKSRGLIDDIHFFYNEWVVVNTDIKRRDYESFEVEFNGQPSPNVTFNWSYVHSSAKGTNPGQFESAGFTGSSGSGNNIGVFLDRPPSNPEGWCGDDYYPDTEGCVPASWVGDWFRDYNNDDQVDYYDRDLYIQTYFAGLGGVDGDDDWYGYLPYSVDDLTKLYARFNIPKWGDTYITLFAQWASGYQTSRRGLQHLYGDYLTFSENPWFGGYEGDCTDFADCVTLFETSDVTGQDFGSESGLARGTLDNGSFWTMDMSVGKLFNISGRMGVELRLEAFNVFNNQVPLTILDTATTSFGAPLSRQFPRSVRGFARFVF